MFRANHKDFLIMFKHKYLIISEYIITTNTPFLFTNYIGLSNINNVVAKSTIEPRNSNNKPTANTSTPTNNRAFFVCSTHTPKEKVNNLFLSMVAWSGKGLALCYYPLVIVFETVTRYRQLLASKLITVTFNTSTNGAKS